MSQVYNTCLIRQSDLPAMIQTIYTSLGKVAGVRGVLTDLLVKEWM